MEIDDEDNSIPASCRRNFSLRFGCGLLTDCFDGRFEFLLVFFLLFEGVIGLIKIRLEFDNPPVDCPFCRVVKTRFELLQTAGDNGSVSIMEFQCVHRQALIARVYPQ